MRRNCGSRLPLVNLDQVLDLDLVRGTGEVLKILVLCLGLGLIYTTTAMAAEPVYMGAKFCRTCHSSADKDRYHLWLESRHAKAFDVLTGAEKTDPNCLSCHTTGSQQPISEKSLRKDLRGVQCEACHGPGSEYKSMKIMKDPKRARANGLWEVTREVCLKCHK
jgi:hypothetical protein